MRIVTIGGRAIRVSVRDGDACRPPLLPCNGLGASLELFQPFIDSLDPRRPVIRFDMPGVGGSPAPVLPYHLATSAPLLAGLLDQLGYQQADVLGISWGGALAQQFAISIQVFDEGHFKAVLRLRTTGKGFILQQGGDAGRRCPEVV